MKHCAITVVAKIREGSDIAALRARLQQLDQGNAIRKQLFGDACARCRTESPVARCSRCARRIHFMSFFVFPDAGPVALAANDPAFIVLEVNGDGSARSLRRLLAERVPGFLELLFRDCENAPAPQQAADTRAWLRFVNKHDVGAGAFYVANPGRGVEQVAVERSLREQATAQLAGFERAVDCTSIWQGIQQRLHDQIAQTKPAPRLPFAMRWGTHGQGLFRQLRAYSRLFGSIVWGLFLFAAAMYAAYWLWRQSGLPMLVRSLLAIAPAVVACTWMLPMWLRERPVHASARRKLAAWGKFLWAWIVCSFELSALFGVTLLAMRLWEQPFDRYQHIFASAAALLPLVLNLITAVALGVFVGVFSGKLAGYAVALLASTSWLYFGVSPGAEQHQLWTMWAATTGVSVIAMTLLVVWFMALVRRAEETDQELGVEFNLPRLNQNTSDEDRGSQNHLATVTELRPEPIRRYALQVVLRAVSLLATIHFNQGHLDRITSIHFARFVIYSHGGRHWLLFMGNYDGGFSAYLGAFSPVLGTSAVWSCTKGFPRTSGLIWDGARDEQRFKAFGRQSQVHTLGWFRAHPTLSTQDISAATATRAALNRVPARRSSSIWATWARVAKSLFGPPGSFEAEIQGPFDEAACDAAVRRL